MNLSPFIHATLCIVVIQLATVAAFAQSDPLKDAKPWGELNSKGVTASVEGRTVLLKLDEPILNSKKAVIPRLCAPIRSIQWQGNSDAELQIKPSQKDWTFSWKDVPLESSTIEIVFDTLPSLPAECPIAVPAGDSSVMLHAFQAKTFGEKILFEPQWYKNTVGYWAIETDYATWDLKIDQPGTFTIAMLQGCGEGQGGSDAVVSLRQDNEVKSELPFTTIDTGHFQNFRWNHLGSININEPGRYELRISAKKIAKVALFDVRAIHLVRQATPK